MRISTRTIAINAAFLQDIKQDNRDLRELLTQGVELFSPERPQPATPASVVEYLERLRDQLALHFALEEAYGYFEEAVDVAPMLSGRADKLRQEHAELFQSVCGLLDAGERLRYHESPHGSLRELAQDFLQFHRRLARHERLENELILDSLADETGVGD